MLNCEEKVRRSHGGWVGRRGDAGLRKWWAVGVGGIEYTCGIVALVWIGECERCHRVVGMGRMYGSQCGIAIFGA